MLGLDLTLVLLSIWQGAVLAFLLGIFIILVFIFSEIKTHNRIIEATIQPPIEN